MCPLGHLGANLRHEDVLEDILPLRSSYHTDLKSDDLVNSTKPSVVARRPHGETLDISSSAKVTLRAVAFLCILAFAVYGLVEYFDFLAQEGCSDLEIGQRVMVSFDFQPSSTSEVVLQQGLEGSVVKVDVSGDACISFCGSDCAIWVPRVNLHNLRKLEAFPTGSEQHQTAVKEEVGTTNRMSKLPPTAKASIGPLTSAPSSSSADHCKDSPPQLSTECVSMASSRSGVLPPALSPSFDSYDEGCSWTVPYYMCRHLIREKLVEVEGCPQLYARCIGGQLEVGRAQDLSRIDVTIGPVGDSSITYLAASIKGPDGQLYGYFVHDGDGFAVRHHSQSHRVLILQPVKTASGSFLEIAAEDARPVCLVRLDDSCGHGVEIDADPDVDGFLLVSCVLACFVAKPELLNDIPASMSQCSSEAFVTSSGSKH